MDKWLNLYLFIYLLFTYLYIYIFIYLFTYLFIYLSIYLLIYWQIDKYHLFNDKELKKKNKIYKIDIENLNIRVD